MESAEGRAEEADAVHEFVDVAGIDLKVDAVDVGEALEQDGLALHHRLGAERAQIAEAEHGRAVGNDRDEVDLRSVVVGLARGGGKFGTGGGDTGRSGEGQKGEGQWRHGGTKPANGA